MSIAEANAVNEDVVIVPQGRTRAIAIIMAILGLFTIWVFAFGSDTSAHSQITFNPINLGTDAPWLVGTLTVASRWTNLVLGLVMIFAGFLMATRYR